MLNLVVAAAYVLISATIVRGLVHTGEISHFRRNRLALATAAIFLTCAMHHGHHGLDLVVDDGSGTQPGLRAASGGWYGISIDALTALVGLSYLTLRRSYGILVRSPAMFDIVSQANYRQLAANLPHTAVYVFDRTLHIVLAEGDPSHGPLHTMPVQEGQHLAEAVPAAALPVFERAWLSALEGSSSDFDHVGPSGAQTYRNRVRPVFDEKRQVVGGLLLSEDVTAEREIQAQLVRALAFNDAVLSASPDITTITDLSTGLTSWASRSIVDMLGPASAPGTVDAATDLLALVVPEDRSRLHAANAAVALLADGESLGVRLRVESPGGRRGRDQWVSRRTTPFGRDAEGQPHQGLSVIREITDVIATEAQLEHAALHDPLTGLPNRILLMDRVASAIDRADREDSEIAVLFCDLDGFKRVNDTAGHAAGDAVLVEVAHRIRRTLHRSDSVGRVGGDEFVIVLEPRHPGPTNDPDDPDGPWIARDSEQTGGAPERAGARATAQSVAERLRQEIAEPIVYEGSAFVISLSIGMTMARPGSVAENVVRDADAAMYLAKHRGKNRLEIFDDALRSNTDERTRVDSALQMALAPGGPPHPLLSVAYQPVLDLRDGRLIGFEALARLTDSLGRPIPPDTFIPIAEETGLISSLGEAVLDAALAGLAQWRRDHPEARPAVIHVNFSARQAQQADMGAIVQSALHRHGLTPGDLILELTESILLQAGSSGLQQLTELHRSGVGIAIDDFGTGYASLRYLAILPISTVKVDRSFTAAMLTDPTSATIVRAIAALSAEMGLSCIVEGIETVEQLAALPAGVLGQGYLLGRPSPNPRNEWPVTMTEDRSA